MQTKTCKYCNKEIHTKAEICPNCGCRVKYNILKTIIIVIIVIGALIGLYMGFITIKDKMYYRKIEKDREVELVRQENVLNSFVGKYKILSPEYIEVSTYTGEYTNRYNLVDEVSINKDDTKYLDGTYIHYMTVDKDHKKIYVYEDSNNIYAVIYLKDLVNEEMDSIYNRYACFKVMDDGLKQEGCKSGLYDSVVDEATDYGVRLEKTI